MQLKTVEEFVSEYQPFVEEWFLFKNQKNFTHVEWEDFWSELLAKILKEDLLNKYNPDHHSKASFETWLKRVLNNLYIDMSKKIARGNWIPITVSDNNDDDENYEILEDRFKIESDEHETADIDIKIISKFVEEIPKIRDRVLVKLKTYIDGYTILKDDEYDYLEGLSDISDVKTFISENIYDNKCGMKDKDICKLMDIKKGSINTTYQRIVSKYLIEPYKIYKAKNG